jgi:hypothetical protein
VPGDHGEEVGVGSGEGDGVGVGDGVVGSGDGDGDLAGDGDEEWDGAGRGELGRGDDDGDEAGGLPCWADGALLGAAEAGRVEEECFPGDGLSADTSVLPGGVDAVDGLCVPAAGCNPVWASECSSMRSAAAPSTTMATAAAPAATAYLPRQRTGHGPARPGLPSGPKCPSRRMTSAR